MNPDNVSKNLTSHLKSIAAIFTGGLLSAGFVMILLFFIFGYVEEQGFSLLDGIVFAMMYSLITSSIFSISFIFFVQTRKVNYYILGIASGLFFWIDGLLLQLSDYFKLQLTGIVGWVTIFFMAILLNVVLFRRDLVLWKKDLNSSNLNLVDRNRADNDNRGKW